MTTKSKPVKDYAGKLADFIMFTQRSFLLNLSSDLNKKNVSFAQFFLLGYLTKEGPLTMTSIAKKMGHSTAAATGLVDRLEKLGYLERNHAMEDRRKIRVKITRKGVDLVAKMREDIVGELVGLMQKLDKNQQETFRKTYGSLIGYIQE